MSSQSSGSGRRRINMQQYSAEDEALNIISKEAEDRLAAKRAARSEAREIRLKEIEKQLNESDRVNEHTNEHAASKGSQSGSRHDSVESSDTDIKDTDFKAELRELEMKYRVAMMSSAQLDNEKQSLVYQVELLKDQLEEQNEEHTELQRDYKEKCRQYDFQKRDIKSMEQELNILKQQMTIKDKLIQESGFVIFANDKGEPVLQKSSQINSSNGAPPASSLLVSADVRDFLRKAEGVTLGTAVAGVNTNNSGVSSQAVLQTCCVVTPSSVDAADGPTVDALLLYGDDNSSGLNDIPASHSSNIDKDNDVVLHDSGDATARKSMSCEHELSRNEPLKEGRGDAISSSISNDNSSFTSGDSLTHSQVSLTPGEKEHSGISMDDSCFTVQTRTSIGTESDSVDEEADEFFDAVCTPSPSNKTFDEQRDQIVLTDANEGTSVDPEIISEENIVELERSLTDVHTCTETGNIFVDNVTETESSTDITDPAIINEDNIVELERSLTDVHTCTESGSIIVDNVTETESSTDITDENEDNNNIQKTESKTDITDINEDDSSKEDIQKTESSTNITNEIEDNSSKEEHVQKSDITSEMLFHKEENDIEDARNGQENGEQADSLKTPTTEIVEIENISNEKSPSSDISMEELSAERKTEGDDNVENDTTEEKLEAQSSYQDSENVENLRQDNIEETLHSETKVEEEHPADVTQFIVTDSQDSSSVENTHIHVQDEVLQVDDTEKHVSEMNVATEQEDIEAIEVSTYDLSTESPIKNKVQQTAEEADFIQSTICETQDSNSVSDTGEPDVSETIKTDVPHTTETETAHTTETDVPHTTETEAPHTTETDVPHTTETDVPPTTEIVCDAAEKQDADSIGSEREDTDPVEVLQDRLNAGSENVEGNDQNCTESEVEDPGKIIKHEINISNNDIDEENEDEKDGSVPLKDTSKMMVRTASFGGSEASDGAGLDDYDLDDIDDILNTGATSSPSTQEHETTPSTEAVLTAEETAGSVDQEDRNPAKLSSDKDVERKHETKVNNNVSKKTKEKTKSSKKEGKEKVKSSEKESKDKTDKTKSKEKENKDKPEKSKSSKKDTAHDKKAEKSKQSKKEPAQESKVEAAGGEEDKRSLNESQTSLELDDLEGALDKQMQESDRRKSPKKSSSKKLSIFKKVFK